MALLPFAGIAFLWFLGVIRDRLGDREDKFFATVLLGSGLLFVAMLFASGAVASSLLSITNAGAEDPQLWAFGRRTAFTLITTYGLRMAAVFTISVSTMAGRLGLLPRGLIAFGYLTALLLMVAVNVVPMFEVLFPAWVLTVSITILVHSFRGAPGTAAPTP